MGPSKKNILFIGKTILDGPRTHPTVFSVRCSKNCAIAFQSKEQNSQGNETSITTSNDKKLQFHAKSPNENMYKIKPCENKHCDREIKQEGHLTSNLTIELQEKLKRKNMSSYPIKGGYGKNEDNNDTHFITSTNKTTLKEDQLRYADKKGSLHTNENEYLKTIINNE